MTPDGIMDSGYTQHSGCPVRKGQKWIATAWLREGVTAKDHSDLFEPSGKRMGMSSSAHLRDNLKKIHEVEQAVF